MNVEGIANGQRGETSIIIAGRTHILRPTFSALVAAEEELGSLYSLVERASESRLRLQEVATLFWHCLADRHEITREQVGDSVIAIGLAGSAAPLRTLLCQILQGRQ